MSTQRALGPVCRLPSGRIVGCEYINGDPATSVPHKWDCECDRCEPERAAASEQVRNAAPDMLAALTMVACTLHEYLAGRANRDALLDLAVRVDAAIAKAEGGS